MHAVKFRSCVSMLVLVSLIGGASAVTRLKIFLLAGQSNSMGWNPGGVSELPANLKVTSHVKINGICGLDMSGKTIHYTCVDTKYAATKGWTYSKPLYWAGGSDVGPNVAFAWDMEDSMKLTGVAYDSIAIIIGGDVGALCDVWFNGSAAGPAFTNYFAGIRRGIADLGPNYQCQIIGVLWMQGESDSWDNGCSNAYAANLTKLIKIYRDTVKDPNLPFVIGKINTDPGWTYNSIVRAKEDSVAAKVPYTGIVETKSFPQTGGHFTATGQVMLGHGFAKEMLRLLSGSTSEKAHKSRFAAVGSRPAERFIVDIKGRMIRAAGDVGGARTPAQRLTGGVHLIVIKSAAGISMERTAVVY